MKHAVSHNLDNLDAYLNCFLDITGLRPSLSESGAMPSSPRTTGNLQYQRRSSQERPTVSQALRGTGLVLNSVTSHLLASRPASSSWSLHRGPDMHRRILYTSLQLFTVLWHPLAAIVAICFTGLLVCRSEGPSPWRALPIRGIRLPARRGPRCRPWEGEQTRSRRKNPRRFDRCANYPPPKPAHPSAEQGPSIRTVVVRGLSRLSLAVSVLENTHGPMPCAGDASCMAPRIWPGHFPRPKTKRARRARGMATLNLCGGSRAAKTPPSFPRDWRDSRPIK